MSIKCAAISTNGYPKTKFKVKTIVYKPRTVPKNTLF